MAVQIPGAYILGWRYQATMPWQDKNIIKIGKMMVPRVMSLAVNNINLIIPDLFYEFNCIHLLIHQPQLFYP